MSSDSSGTQTARKRWYRRIPWWGWVAVVIVVVIAAAAGGGGGSDKPTADATTTPPAASEPSSPGAEQSSEDTTQPADDAPASEPTSLTAEHVEAFLKESYGLSAGDSWKTLCAADPGFYPYPCAIASMELSGAGVLRVTVQESLTKDDAEQYARGALNFLCTTKSTTAEFASVTWVEIADTSGGTRGQMSASSNPMCSANR